MDAPQAPPTTSPSSVDRLTAQAAVAGLPLAVGPAVAAGLLSIGRTTLYGLLDSGAIPSRKCGRRRLIEVRALQDFLTNSEASKPAMEGA